jgi:hypothetical protein
MSCLTDLVFIADPCSTQPTTCPQHAVSITDVGGFSWGDVTQIKPDIYNRIYPYLKKVVYNACEMLTSDIKIELERIGYRFDSNSLTEQSGAFKGTIISVTNGKGAWAKIKTACTDGVKPTTLRKVYFKPANTGGSTTVTVNLQIGYETFTQNVELQMNGQLQYFIPCAPQGGLFTCQKDTEVFVTISTALGSIDLIDIKPYCGCDGSERKQFSSKGWDGSAFRSECSYGILLEFGSTCDLDAIFCRFTDNMQFRQLLKLALEIQMLNDRLKSSNLSYVVLFGKDDAEKRVLELKNGRKDGLYNELLQSFVSSIKNNLRASNTCGCVECGGLYTAVNY